jgi:preprotein translocase subunit Sss1
MGSKMIQIRHVPEDVHARLKARAAAAGMSLSDYLLREITWMASRPTWDEYFDAVKGEEPIATGVDWAEVIREGREERERELEQRTMRSFRRE